VSFDDEWSRLLAAAGERKAVQTRLNQLDGEGGGGSSADSSQGELTVEQKDLAAIGDATFKLRERLIKDGDHTRASSYAAAAYLSKDFAVGGALDYVTTRWQDQVRTLTDACGHISNHLEYSNKAHANDEQHISSVFHSISQLSEGFNERPRR